MLPQTIWQLDDLEMALAHTPVLLEELLELLSPREGEVAVDCTFGAGGHAAAVAGRLGATGRLVAIDRDPHVSEFFADMSRAAPCECRFYQGNFADVLATFETASADIVYMDLGVSSMQLDRRERGFSYAYDAPLDMRMDPALDVSAAHLVNTLGEAELTDIFRRYGEERYASSIARGIVLARAKKPHQHDLRAGRDHQESHPHAGAVRRRQSGAPRLPGAAHRRQRRAALAGARSRRGVPGAQAGRPPRRHQFPFA